MEHNHSLKHYSKCFSLARDKSNSSTSFLRWLKFHRAAVAIASIRTDPIIFFFMVWYIISFTSVCFLSLPTLIQLRYSNGICAILVVGYITIIHLFFGVSGSLLVQFRRWYSNSHLFNHWAFPFMFTLAGRLSILLYLITTLCWRVKFLHLI
mgnify:CR=1 FL=1